MVRKTSSSTKAAKGSKKKEQKKERRISGVGTRPRRNSIGAKPRRNSISGKKVAVKRRSATRKKINSGSKGKKTVSAKKRSARKSSANKNKRRVTTRQRVSANKKRKRKSGKAGRAAGRKKRRMNKRQNAQQKPRIQAKCGSNLGSVMFSPFNYKTAESPSRSIVCPHPSLAIMKHGKLGDESAVVWGNAFKVASPKMNKSVFQDSSEQYETSTEISVSSIDPEELKSLNRSKSQPFKKVTPHHSLKYSFHEEANDAKRMSRTAEAKAKKEARNNTSVLNISYAKGQTPALKAAGDESIMDTTLQLTLATPKTGRLSTGGKAKSGLKGGLKKNKRIFFQSLNTPKSKPGGGMSTGAAARIVNSFAVARKRACRFPPGEGVSFQRIDSYF